MPTRIVPALWLVVPILWLVVPIPWLVVPKPGMVKIEVISGNLDIVEELRVHNQSLLAGCGLIILIGVFALAGFLILLFVRDRESARYPGSVPISSHSNYKGLPFEYRWDNSYRTSDNFTDVYNWYSVTFDLGAESRANGECILLEGSNSQFAFSRHYSVFLCSTLFGQMIYVTRSTSFTGRSAILTGVEDLRRSFSFVRPRPGGQ
jgi:hypothetical protein